MQAVVALFLLAALAVVIVPSFDEEMTEESLLALDRDFAAGSAEERGRQVYIREGCFYCHTQEVRAIITDVGLGPVSRPGDYALEGATLGGTERVGPDLMHAGSRGATADPGWVAAHVARPRDASGPAAARPWSNMPAYDHLSAGDLEAVAAYIAALD
jgi:cbb3-type cytochrome c oxidase subunit II